MQYQQKTIQLRDGRTALFRQPTPQDAAGMIQYMKTCYSETPYLLRYPEEFTLTVEQEADFLQKEIDFPNSLMIACEVEGEIAGNCSISGNKLYKNRHRADLGISLIQKYWHLGIGTAMFEELIRIAKENGIEQLELEVMEGNDRAIQLYKKFGFVQYGARPNAIHLKDGSCLQEILMFKTL